MIRPSLYSISLASLASFLLLILFTSPVGFVRISLFFVSLFLFFAGTFILIIFHKQEDKQQIPLKYTKGGIFGALFAVSLLFLKMLGWY